MNETFEFKDDIEIKGLAPRKKPTQRRSKQTVEDILKASAMILEKDGPSKLNTNHIAKMSGVSIGSLYQYFPNKESILIALVERQHEKRIQVLEELIKESSSWPFEELVEKLIKALYKTQHTGPRLERILAEVKYQMGLPRLDYQLHDQLIDLLEREIHKKTYYYEAKDLRLSLRIIVYAIKAITLDSLYDEKLGDFETFTQEVKRMALNYLKINQSFSSTSPNLRQ